MISTGQVRRVNPLPARAGVGTITIKPGLSLADAAKRLAPNGSGEISNKLEEGLKKIGRADGRLNIETVDPDLAQAVESREGGEEGARLAIQCRLGIAGQAFDFSRVVRLSREELWRLTNEQIKALGPEQIKALGPEQIKALGTWQIRELEPEQIKALEPKQIRALESSINSLRPEQIKALESWQIKALGLKQIKALNPEMIWALELKQIMALESLQIKALGVEHITKLKPEQVWALRPDQIKALEPWQIWALRPDQLEELEPEQLKALRPEPLSLQTGCFTIKELSVIAIEDLFDKSQKVRVYETPGENFATLFTRMTDAQRVILLVILSQEQKEQLETALQSLA